MKIPMINLFFLLVRYYVFVPGFCATSCEVAGLWFSENDTF
jgi:hypothetical protein